MKKSFFALIMLLVLSVSCEKVALPVPELSSTSYEVEVRSYSNKPAFSLEWELSGGNAEVTKTYIQFASDKEFITPYVASASGNSYVVTFRDIQKMNAVFGNTEDFTLYIRLLVEGEDVQSIYSNKIKIEIDLP